MRDKRHYIAVDLGAESGRVMLGAVAEDRVQVEEVHRFPNVSRKMGDTLRWDFDALMAAIKTGIAKAVAAAPAAPSGIAVDSWGVDFGLLDASERLIEPPCHYRDARTHNAVERAAAVVSRERIYALTGIQIMQINSLFQLLAMHWKNDPALAKARRLAFMADLVAHALCGRLYAEYSLASTSQLMDMRTGQWSADLLRAFGLPQQILPEIVAPCTVVGALTDAVAREIGCGSIPVIAAASHDTAAAVAAVPAEGDGWAYLSSGTWSLMGAETPGPVINDLAFAHGLTNEGGVDGTIRLLKNIMGLWLVQECRRQWQREGADFSYAELTAMAAKARPFAARIDPDQPEFLAPGDMPAKINAFLVRSGQKPLSDRGEMVRSLLEALALTYRTTRVRLESLLGHSIRTLHIVGGGSQNELLNQFTADALNVRVVAGPVEATSIGNVLLQARATGQVRSLDHLRAIVRNSFPIRTYLPQNTAPWEKA